MGKPVVHLYGLGNIGFRHLQGLAALSDEIQLVGVDPSVERCALARSEWKALREQLQGVADWTMTQAGPNWGLACNGVHFIDLMQFLSGGGAPSAEGIAIDQIIPSKRSGYFEVEGQLTVELGGRRLVLVQRPDAGPGLTIESALGRWSVTEAAGVLIDAGTGETLIDVGRSPYQSELTAAVASPLLAGATPPVASLAEARLAHAPLIEALTPVFEAAGHDVSGGLPIT